MSEYVEYEDIEDITDDIQEPKKKAYEKMPKEVKEDIEKIMGGNLGKELKKSSAIDMRATLLGGVIGGGVAMYKGWKVWLGIVVGALIGGVINKNIK